MNKTSLNSPRYDSYEQRSKSSIINRKTYSDYLKKQIEYNKQQKSKEKEMDKILIEKAQIQCHNEDILANKLKKQKEQKLKHEFKTVNDNMLRMKALRENVYEIHLGNTS